MNELAQILSSKAIDANMWNAVSLPIPINASKELLVEILQSASCMHDIYNDDIKDYHCSGLDAPHDIEMRASLACERWHVAKQRLAEMGFDGYGDPIKWPSLFMRVRKALHL